MLSVYRCYLGTGILGIVSWRVSGTYTGRGDGKIRLELDGCYLLLMYIGMYCDL